MTIVGGFDVHRAQITFDYLDTERLGALRPGPPGHRRACAALVGRALPGW